MQTCYSGGSMNQNETSQCLTMLLNNNRNMFGSIRVMPMTTTKLSQEKIQVDAFQMIFGLSFNYFFQL